MFEEVAAASALAGVLLAPAVVSAARSAPALRLSSQGLPDPVVAAGEPTEPASASVIAPASVAPSFSSSVAPGLAPGLAPGVALRGRSVLLVAAVTTGVVLAVMGGRLGADAALPAYVAFGVVAVILAIVDVEHHRLPDVLTLPSYPLGVGLLAFAHVAGSESGSLPRALLGGLVAFVLFATLYLAAPSGIGAGDVKFAGVVGLYAAWLGWGSLVVALVGGFVVGAVVSLVLLAAGRADRRTRVPFGPSMVVGAVVAIGWGEAIAGVWRGG